MQITNGGQLSDTYIADEEGFELLKEKLENGEATNLVWHIVGMDHQHHAHGLKGFDEDLIRGKIEAYLTEITEKMDDDTTLVVFGDHGSNADGFHGESTEGERTSVLFLYSKGAPFLREQKIQDILGTKIAPIISQISQTKLPFLNEGRISSETELKIYDEV